MSLMGLLFGWEVDALFLTAVLMVVGFSVQDTIVLFDRIRENIPKHLGEPYEVIVNRSILETIHRSLAIQLNVFFIIIAILLFGGELIKQFIGHPVRRLADGHIFVDFHRGAAAGIVGKGRNPIRQPPPRRRCKPVGSVDCACPRS